ncbi:MAG: 4-hydroxy-3-methylbut-2-enyl diphosphate reductase [Armatimonadetes bacterium]|nr:4-hydroxy-3-methylbut-2-enyl diphosphate reductase [Armatimonadota bacterium]
MAKKIGFCFGVKRAIELAYQTLEKSKSENSPLVFTLGPIVHNPQVVRQLEKDGIITINDLKEIKKGYLLIRTHGVPPLVLSDAENKGLTIIDATCPLVQRIHKIVTNLKKENYQIIIIGHKDHPEVVGIAGYAGKDHQVIEKIEDLEKIKLDKKLGIVGQTTLFIDNFQKIVLNLIEKAYECRIYNTICFETQARQKATLDLAKEVDLMLVVGGKNSSNTKRLLEICKELNTPVYLIEGAKDLKFSWFNLKKKIGLTAGASTPIRITQEVLKKIKNNK